MKDHRHRLNDVTLTQLRPGPRHSDDPLSLENQLCFALYAATRAITRTYRERLVQLDLTYSQYLVLIALWENDRQTVSALGEQLRLDSGTVTPLLKRMETAGLLERQRRRTDERVVEVFLTPKGRALKTGAAGAREFVVERLGMTDVQIANLRRELMDLVAQLDC